MKLFKVKNLLKLFYRKAENSVLDSALILVVGENCDDEVLYCLYRVGKSSLSVSCTESRFQMNTPVLFVQHERMNELKLPCARFSLCEK